MGRGAGAGLSTGAYMKVCEVNFETPKPKLYPHPPPADKLNWKRETRGSLSG